MFVHFNLLHVGMNASCSWPLVRPPSGELGNARFVLLFVLTGVLGFVASDLWAGWVSGPTPRAHGGRQRRGLRRCSVP